MAIKMDIYDSVRNDILNDSLLETSAQHVLPLADESSRIMGPFIGHPRQFMDFALKSEDSDNNRTRSKF